MRVPQFKFAQYSHLRGIQSYSAKKSLSLRMDNQRPTLLGLQNFTIQISCTITDWRLYRDTYTTTIFLKYYNIIIYDNEYFLYPLSDN